jgi:hypothetical protein
MPKGWLYNWEGMAKDGKVEPRDTFFGRKLACCLSVCPCYL